MYKHFYHLYMHFKFFLKEDNIYFLQISSFIYLHDFQFFVSFFSVELLPRTSRSSSNILWSLLPSLPTDSTVTNLSGLSVRTRSRVLPLMWVGVETSCSNPRIVQASRKTLPAGQSRPFPSRSVMAISQQVRKGDTPAGPERRDPRRSGKGISQQVMKGSQRMMTGEMPAGPDPEISNLQLMTLGSLIFFRQLLHLHAEGDL